MSDPIKKLEEKEAALMKKIDDFEIKPFETPDMAKSRYEGLIREKENTSAALDRALEKQAISK